MSPLAPAGSIGYNDYQRTVNYDGPQFPVLAPGVTNAPHNTGVMNVARYAYLAGLMQEVLSGCGVSVEWFADQAATISLGSRTFQLSSHIPVPMQFKFINLGPWVQVFVSAQGGANYNFTGQFFPSNRQYPLESQPADPVVIDQQTVVIGASSTNTVYPTDYYAGPVSAWLFTSFTTGTLAFQVLSGSGAWDYFYQLEFTVLNSHPVVLVVPTGAWRILVNNTTAGASTYDLAVIPSQTGAS